MIMRNKTVMNKTRVLILSILCSALLTAGVAIAADSIGGENPLTSQENQILIRNVRVFDGTSSKLSGVNDVLIVGNMIKEVSSEASKSAGSKAQIIDGGGRVLIPGMSDTHAHLSFATIPLAEMLNGMPGYNHIRSTIDARDMLMRGITTVRDMGGAVFGLKQAIDEGLVPGPRIYPSGALISQTSGHFDFRYPNQDHPRFGGVRAELDKENYIRLADGVADVLAAARENLRHGASQIKIAAGGGYSSPTDPIMSTQYTFDEMKAAANAATDFGTYATCHAYTTRAINRAIDAGFKDIGHGQLLDEATLKRMAEEGIFLSTQPFTVCHEGQLDDNSNKKLAVVCKGTEFVYKTAKKYPELKITYGTDIFNNPAQIKEQVKMMDRLSKWYKPVEILKMATGNTTELYKLSGMKNPYPDGDIGVIKKGAYADVLLIEGNPLKDIKVIGVLDNLRVIIKDGKIYKNTL
jgi:imidazolonepropionase-like amidohydrolase